MKTLLTEEQARRKIQLSLTHRYAEMLLTLCRNEIKKRRRNYDPNFVPEPGKYDTNLMRIQAMESIIKQIQEQMPSNYSHPPRKGTQL